MLRLVEANIGHQCAWCMDSSGKTPFLDVVGERLERWKSSAQQAVVVDVLTSIEQTMVRFFNATWSWSIGDEINGTDVETVRDEFRRASSVVEDAMKTTQETMHLVNEASYLNRELLNNVWELECKVQLQKLLDEYHRHRQSFKKVVDEFRRYLKVRVGELRRHVRRYTANEDTLETVGRETNFVELRLKLLGTKITIDRSLDKGQLLLNNIQSQINKIYYSIMSYVSRDHIKSESAYWSHLNVRDPSIKLPAMKEVGGIQMAEVDYGMVPDVGGLEKWAEKVDSLTVVRLKMERYIRVLMDEALANSRDYLQDYLKGNQIDEEFYR
ncbi:hypothetical protein LSH36_196g03006 [Paralvinella palmiformis]|uniref:Uncharacterized protein n=1 Tax=Paralvinella palmiformis TaxID=53620 RepID=A0AAD9JS38_9ANNE|nr:hypothetical protein LSH36_196g03006 [Paralvinella palmiformis]